MTPRRNITRVAVTTVKPGAMARRKDVVAIEEPLEIRLSFEAGGKRVGQSVAVTMRTPGDDYELAAGFLFSEGLIRSGMDVQQISYCVGTDKLKQQFNTLSVTFRPGVQVNLERLTRHVYTSSSCGLCGKATLDALDELLSGAQPPRPLTGPLESEVVRALPERLQAAQTLFEKTGGVHAAGLFTPAGKLLALKEDVGRHNAVDKVIGAELLAGRMPLSNCVLAVSSRASFEIMQKAVLAGIPAVVAVGAPSSLAIETAQRYGQTLIGFARADRFNVYSGSVQGD